MASASESSSNTRDALSSSIKVSSARSPSSSIHMGSCEETTTYETQYKETVTLKTMNLRKEKAIRYFNFVFDWKWFIFPGYLLLGFVALFVTVYGLENLSNGQRLTHTFWLLLVLNLTCMLSGAWLVFQLGTVNSTIDEVDRLVGVLEGVRDKLQAQVDRLCDVNEDLDKDNSQSKKQMNKLKEGMARFDSLMVEMRAAEKDVCEVEEMASKVRVQLKHMLQLASETQRSQLVYYFLREAVSNGTFTLSTEEYEWFLQHMNDKHQALWQEMFDFDTLAGKSGDAETIGAEDFYVALDKFVKEYNPKWIDLQEEMKGSKSPKTMSEMAKGMLGKGGFKSTQPEEEESEELGRYDTIDIDDVLQGADEAIRMVEERQANI